MSKSETTKTVLVAGAANLILAITKLFAGLLAGSSAMLAESAHSVADTLNQGFLYTSLRRSERPPDRRHPFGYGNERYVWSLLAAFGIFVAGAGFSIFEGILTMTGHGAGGTTVWLAYAVLGLGAVLEGASWIRAFHQAKKETRESDRDLVEHVRKSPDVTFKTALFEDTAAMVGLALAAGGLAMRQITGSEFWDGLASALIGVLLVVLAFSIGRESVQLLIGRAADPAEQREIRAEICGAPGVTGVDELLTMHFGPEQLLVAAKVHFSDDISADEAEDVAGEIDRRLRERVPTVRHVFLDPTQRVIKTSAG
ncbi:cation diffusion facilitator family transporter [Actinomadura coerulea]|uniref:Cation diffusion facilitator family transporter n=1 Tax=Actinomadura coerulea TaxID=46159 RepID=A0A7X0G7J4_9ACTN|nr:cation diffusion facilitator family transporter [Actinomadura coerulea]MBB6399731.1 cation diffusion facilitator family transporter [Actinomadura coerulea]GGQ11662.1 cation diffusion facilitator transporter [Actinomadura coerulea]